MTNEVISPLRWRMIEDMTIRKLAPKTQVDYIRHVKYFAAFLGADVPADVEKAERRCSP